ncbi:hypothetical protein MLD38_010170 [Melastoma candidum]|uniref:Uncharacterized protein n=1 Tax=Melastoma candidum TaxID=119954 RepID=A0ACB9R233_9MYRT|nr:hypothetical protein MLD38_010170 [Melastoma candidum]
MGAALFHTIWPHLRLPFILQRGGRLTFKHAIKSAEPVFSVMVSSFLLDTYPLAVWLSILPGVFECYHQSVVQSQQIVGPNNQPKAVGLLSTFYIWVMLSGIFYHLHNQFSYLALVVIGLLAFSVGNSMKRVVVIMATVLLFRNPVRPLNAQGLAITILGTFLFRRCPQRRLWVTIKRSKAKGL